jgi:hypothetical protein
MIMAFLSFPGFFGAQETPKSLSLPQGRVEGTLPLVLKLKTKSAFTESARLASMGPREPQFVAPSAKAYGHSEFSPLPANLSFYAGLNEKTGPTSTASLSAVEVRFVKGPSFLMAVDTTCGEVLIGSGMARKLHLKEGKETSVELQPFHMGSLNFSGVPARVVNREDLPGDSVDGVLPLGLFRGFEVSWDPKSKTLTLASPGHASGTARGARSFIVPCRWPGGALCLEVSLQSQIQGLMLVDASAAHTVLDLPAVERAGISFRPWGDVKHNEIIKGGVAEKVRLKIGSAEVTILTARVVGMDERLPPGCLGILGQDVLNLFGYSFEPGSSTLVLTPQAAGGTN